MFQNKKGVSIVTITFWVLTFVILWFAWLGKWLAQAGRDLVTLNNLTGVEALFYDNLNLVVWIGLLSFILAYGFLGGANR